VTEAIAIVGMACRFPGAASPEAYWALLRDGIEAVREPPRGRSELEPPPWLVDQAPTCRRGGFLDELDAFEPGFFRISPREAARMDPQQRLLLEVAWEALEDAGQPVAGLAGTTTGVFVGVMNADFARRHSRDLTQIDAQLGPGSSLGIAPNRISFVLDLRGPSMAIDTLCSSSLVSVHLACQSLLANESSPVAIAGGVNVILDRSMDVFYARAGLLSREARCRAFDASAGGIVRGEGCGLVVLKRLSRAVADGDRIHAVIRGSAVNQDGRSNGLTSPSRWSQEAVLRTAYQRAGVVPSRVAYVEAHGTGTLIGDPIETSALGAVMNEGREAPCAIGSVKTNLGHLESAAGVASLIKTALSLRNRALVPSLHFERENPYVRFAERGLRVPTTTQPWAGELIAGVSSFGMGGTNAHVVVGAADDAPSIRKVSRSASLIPISARTTSALDVIEARTVAQLATHEPIDIAHSAGTRRDHHDHRRALLALAGNELVSIRATTGRKPRLVFVLPDVRSDGADELVALWRSVGIEPDEIVRGAASLDESGLVIELGPQSASRGSFLHAIGTLYCLGFEIDWKRLDAADARYVPLGTYPWQREACGAQPEVPAMEVLVPRWERVNAVEQRFTGEWVIVGEGANAIVDELVRRGQRARAGEPASTDTHVVALCGPDLAPTIRLVQALASRDVRLWLVTRGACVVDGDTTLASIASAPVWGFGRVVMNEYPGLRCTLVDLSAEDPASLVRELFAGNTEREVALRGGTRYVARLGRQTLAPGPVRLRADAAYLVTGGLGALGLAAARKLVERGARTLVLLSRRGVSTDEARRAIAELAERGATVIVECADISDREAVAGVVSRHRVRGVIHAAGVPPPGLLCRRR
jgi:3-oxoacyl-(acyl-carrier-protein) synthase